MFSVWVWDDELDDWRCEQGGLSGEEAVKLATSLYEGGREPEEIMVKDERR